MKLHNEQFPDRKVTIRTFFRLLNTYSPMVRSLMTLDPNDTPIQQLGVNTALNLIPMWTKNIASNIDRIKADHDIRELKGIHKGKSAIIIGGGPSLYDNASKTNHLELIAQYKDKFDGIIIVVNRSLEPCLKLGIGDYLCVVDGSEVIYQFFDNDTVRNYKGDMEGIIATCTNKKVVDAWKNRTYFFVPSIPAEILPNATSLMCEFTDSTDINAGGNCGMLAWNLAAWMGCKEIALVGMDLAYKVTTPLNELQSYQLHVRALGEDKAHLGYTTGKHPFFKTPFRLDEIYKAFRDTAVVWIKAFKERGTCTTYNCTEGGAIYGEGIEYMYLKEFLESRCR